MSTLCLKKSEVRLPIGISHISFKRRKYFSSEYDSRTKRVVHRARRCRRRVRAGVRRARLLPAAAVPRRARRVLVRGRARRRAARVAHQGRARLPRSVPSARTARDRPRRSDARRYRSHRRFIAWCRVAVADIRSASSPNSLPYGELILLVVLALPEVFSDPIWCRLTQFNDRRSLKLILEQAATI